MLAVTRAAVSENRLYIYYALWISLLGGGAWMSVVIHLISYALMAAGLLLMGAGCVESTSRGGSW